MKPPQLGERLGVARELERNVKGYKTLKRELDTLKIVLEQQQNARERSKMEKCIKTKYYKSAQGIR